MILVELPHPADEMSDEEILDYLQSAGEPDVRARFMLEVYRGRYDEVEAEYRLAVAAAGLRAGPSADAEQGPEPG